MSKPRLWSVPPAPDLARLKPLTPESLEPSTLNDWQMVRPRTQESCRWESVDGRWITLSLGSQVAEVGKVVVADSNGRRELIDSYEGALALAKSWRTS